MDDRPHKKTTQERTSFSGLFPRTLKKPVKELAIISNVPIILRKTIICIFSFDFGSVGAS